MTALDIRLNSFSKEELKANSKSTKLMEAALASNSCILKTDNGPQLWRRFNTPLYRKFTKAQEYMERVAIDLLSQKIRLFKETKDKKPKTLLEGYLSSPEVDFKDITGMICDFLLAGIDTSAYTTSFVLYYLSCNPKVQEALHEESKTLLSRWDEPVTKEILNKAHYTKAVLKESLRLRPVSVGIGRVLDKDAIFSGYHVPKQTVVVSQNQVSCRFEEYFENPNEFKPERWLRSYEAYKSVHPFLVLPFGHGPRSCIARWLAEQNIRILLLKLSRRFKIRWNGGALDSKSLLINKPDGPIKLIFDERK
ncbi:cytochrome P450 302a1, mitochondrial-like [Agrilus planipennis]|uniref:Cytochrome P450 302a1, mitochondrial-like n=1 Tax=Agrilus planipennis TaxID=224129 RepID=A0A1W4WWS9_AGRPL|nr:cytochrome P450 302a1, mitochondrial-like [Agrilus planipennis]